MSSNLGTINVVFQADVATAVAGLRSLSQQLDASIASSIARSNQFSSAVSSMSTNLASAISRTAASAGGFSNTVTSAFGKIPASLGSAVSQVARNGNALANSLGTISGQITVTVDQATRKTRDLSGAFSLLTAAVSAFSLKSFIDAVGTYDQQLEAIRVLTRETAAEFKATREAVLALAQGLQVSAIDVARGLNDIVQAGFTAADGLKVLEAAIKASKVGLTSAAVASSALIQTLNAFGIAAGDSEATVGKLVRAVDLGVFSFERLATNIGQAAPLAATIGVRLEELLALFTALTRKEANLDEVTTQVRAAFSDLLAPSDRARAAMERVLGTTVEASVRTRGFTATLKALIDSADGSAAALAGMFPNIRAMAGLSKLAGDGFAQFAGDIKKLESASVGSLNRALEVSTRSFGSLVSQIKATAANSLISYFEKNRAAFVTYAEAVNRFVRDNPEFLAGLAKTAITFAALATAVGAARIAVAGFSLALSALATAGATIRFIFSGQALTSLLTYIDQFNLLLFRFSSFAGVASRIPPVVAAAAAAQQAAASTAAAYAQATASATTAANTAITASQNMANARKAELAAENALILAKQRQAVIDARVAGLTLAASNRNPVTGQFKPASQSAANLLPTAAKELAAANKEVAASESALLAAQSARQAAVGRSVVASQALSAANAEVATTSAAATTAANAEAAAMGRLTAATGSAAAAQAELAAVQAGASVTGAAASATTLGALSARMTTIGSSALAAARGLGVLALAGATFVAKAVATAAAAGAIGFAIGKVIEKSLEFFGIIEDRSGLEVASDQLLALVENQKRFNEEVNRAEFAKKMSEGEKAAANLAERLQNLADLARSAAAGNEESARKFFALSRQFEQEGGRSGATRLLETLKGQYDSLAAVVKRAIDNQIELGVQGEQGLARIDAATGKVIGTTDNLLTILTAVVGEVRAREVVDQLAQIEKQMNNVRAATAAYASATFDLRNKNVSLTDAIKEASKTVGEYAEKIKKIAEDREKSGLTASQKEARALDEERQQLLDINQILETRIKLIQEAVIKTTDGDTPEARSAIRALQEQQKAANDALSANDAAYTKLFEEELRKRVDAENEAADRIEEAEIEILRQKGDALEADFRAAELAQAKRLRQIEAERTARVKAAREAVGLSDEQRSALIDAINKQADDEIAASDRVFKSRLDKANDEQIDRQKKSEEGKRIEEEKEKVRKQNEASKEADEIAEKIREAEINGEIEKRNDLVRDYVKKLEEAGRVQEAQLVREREMNRSASQRLQLLQDEIRDRLNAGQGAAGVAEAARGAQSRLVGSNDVGSFRGGVRDKLSEFNSEAEARKFVDAVTSSLKVEFDALEAQRRDAINRGDKKAAEEIAQKQREVVVKYEALLDEIARREVEIKKNALQQPQQAPQGAPTNNATSTARSVQQPAPQQQATAPAAPTTPSTNALPGAITRVSDATTRLVASIESSSKATIAAAQTISAKLDQAVKVLNTHTAKINEVDLRVQRLRIVAVNSAPE